MEKNVDAFIEYLKAQVGEPYLWGGQHTRLTPENYKAVIERRESDPKHRAEAMTFCEKKFRAGATVLYAYDCSGLGCYWLCNLTHLYKGDVNANTMMGRCVLKDEPPKRGWWVFRLSGQRASHIGYMIDDEYLIEAKGRKYGVVKTKFRAKDWDRWGVPKVFEKELTSAPAPEPEPQPERVRERADRRFEEGPDPVHRPPGRHLPLPRYGPLGLVRDRHEKRARVHHEPGPVYEAYLTSVLRMRIPASRPTRAPATVPERRRTGR